MPGGYTGNGSVQWFVDAKDVDTAKGPHSNPNGAGRHHQDGNDKTPLGGRFKIKIKYPQEPAERIALRVQLLDALNQSGTADTITFDIPIEDQQWLDTHPAPGRHLYSGTGENNQIYVDWP